MQAGQTLKPRTIRLHIDGWLDGTVLWTRSRGKRLTLISTASVA